MKKVAVIFIAGLLLCCCKAWENVYQPSLNELTVRAVYPEDFSSFVREGVTVTVEDVNLGNRYGAETDAAGIAVLTVPNGLYRIGVTDRGEEDIFNGSADKVLVSGADVNIPVPLKHSRSGAIVIKEIYCGGCKRLPQEGDYHSDAYIILHNNDFRVQYLDSLCFGTLFPFNSTGTNNWVSKDPATGETIFPDFVPVAQCVWQFGGDGTSFPLQPGEDAVIAVQGAIDHTIQYPLSVNLNKPDYFVCYNSTYFTNTTYHPAPGAAILPERHLNVVIKTGQANAYTLSQNSPAVVIFKAAGTTIQEFVATEGAVKETPGDSRNPIVAVPFDWVVDAVEVFNGGSSANSKRLSPALDAGYVGLSDTALGHTLFRHTDLDLTESSGYEVLRDTNNSTLDFYERETQSLHE